MTVIVYIEHHPSSFTCPYATARGRDMTLRKSSARVRILPVVPQNNKGRGLGCNRRGLQTRAPAGFDSLATCHAASRGTRRAAHTRVGEGSTPSAATMGASVRLTGGHKKHRRQSLIRCCGSAGDGYRYTRFESFRLHHFISWGRSSMAEQSRLRQLIRLARVD